MKTLSIIVEDNTVAIDGVPQIVDCSSLGATVHAVQWNEARQRGHIEFVDDDPDDGQRPANESIVSVAPYQALIDAWHVAATAVPPTPVMPPQSQSGGANVIA